MKKSKKSKKKAILSFDDEDDQEEIVQVKIKKASVDTKLNAGSNNSAYNKEMLDSLKSQQMFKSVEKSTEFHSLEYSKDQIEAAKKSRLLLRNKQLSESVDYIQVDENQDETAIQKYNKIDLDMEQEMKEEQEMDDIEAYEDNQGSIINFGSSSILNAESNRKREFARELDTAMRDHQEDDEIMDWESGIIKSHLDKKTRELLPNLRQEREPKAIPSIKLKLSELTNESQTISQNIKHLENVKRESENNILKARDLDIKLKTEETELLEKQSFFNDLQMFLDDFASLMAAKGVEKELAQLNQSEIKLTGEQFNAKKESIAAELDDFLEDADPDFQALDHILKKQLQPWATFYPKEWQLAYGHLSIPGISCIFVRSEMLNWDPFSIPYKQIEAFNWHSIILDFVPEAQSVEVLQSIVQKWVIPKVKSLIPTRLKLSNYDTCQGLVHLVRDLEMYNVELTQIIEAASSVLKETVEALVKQYTAPIDLVDSHAMIFESKLFIQNLIPLNTILPKDFCIELAFSLLCNRVLVPCLKQTKGGLADLAQLLSQIPGSWVGGDDDIECVWYLKEVQEFAYGKRDEEREMAMQILKVIKSFEKLSRIC